MNHILDYEASIEFVNPAYSGAASRLSIGSTGFALLLAPPCHSLRFARLWLCDPYRRIEPLRRMLAAAQEGIAFRKSMELLFRDHWIKSQYTSLVILALLFEEGRDFPLASFS